MWYFSLRPLPALARRSRKFDPPRVGAVGRGHDHDGIGAEVRYGDDLLFDTRLANEVDTTEPRVEDAESDELRDGARLDDPRRHVLVLRRAVVGAIVADLDPQLLHGSESRPEEATLGESQDRRTVRVERGRSDG